MFVGSCHLDIVDPVAGSSFPVWVLYPTHTPSANVKMGPYSVDVAQDAVVAEGPFPLIVWSHGTGGSHLVYRTLAAFLAEHGYVVALPEHPGNNRNNNDLEGTHENLEGRPRHVRLILDAVSSDARFRDHVRANDIGIIGHSMGGYTALAVAGGTPTSEAGIPVQVVKDERVKSLVLLAPATPWFQKEGSLSQVEAPILMLSAEHDPHTTIWHAEVVLRGVRDPAKVHHVVIENAGHYSFLSPFPRVMRSPAFPPSTDPEGFDRERFHEKLEQMMLNFLVDTLGS